MEWLSNLNKGTVFNYRNLNTDEILSATLDEFNELLSVSLEGLPNERFSCEGELYVYAGFEPRKLNITTKITFEKNGRKALRVTHSDGSSSVRSLTKENYIEGKGTQSVLTSACREASNKEKLKQLRRKHAQWTKGA